MMLGIHRRHYAISMRRKSAGCNSEKASEAAVCTFPFLRTLNGHRTHSRESCRKNLLIRRCFLHFGGRMHKHGEASHRGWALKIEAETADAWKGKCARKNFT